MRPTGTVLFASSVDQLDGPLFRDPSDLARFLSREKIVAKAPKSLAAYLAQVLTYAGPRSRPISDTLREQIATGIRRRFELLGDESDPATADHWVRQFLDATAADEASRGAPSHHNAELLFQELVARTKNSQVQFIVTSNPAETVRSERARTLNELLLDRLGLDGSGSGDETTEIRVRYTFNLPSDAVGLRFWRSLARTIEKHVEATGSPVDREQIHATLQARVTSKNLKVQRIPAHMCVCPTVVFEPADSDAVGFNLYYHNEGEARPLVSVAKMDTASLDAWKSEVHLAIVKGDLPATEIAVPAIDLLFGN